VRFFIYLLGSRSKVYMVTHTHIHTHTHTHTRTHTGGGTKQATLETGALVQVPAFIDAGTKIRVDTRTKTYLGKAN